MLVAKFENNCLLLSPPKSKNHTHSRILAAWLEILLASRQAPNSYSRTLPNGSGRVSRLRLDGILHKA